ncbi:hypothetical protein [Nonomuraea sp. NPDC049784]|uniref:hypothetical protein n=1 Tax=Nonomuraea sp. NPDC049784 TaxID=3154361 RepID=UPI0033CD5A1F
MSRPGPEPSTVDWKRCPGKPEVDCGTVTAPVGWSKPDGPTIQVALARREATDPGHPHRVDAVRPG